MDTSKIYFDANEKFVKAYVLYADPNGTSRLFHDANHTKPVTKEELEAMWWVKVVISTGTTFLLADAMIPGDEYTTVKCGSAAYYSEGFEPSPT